MKHLLSVLLLSLTSSPLMAAVIDFDSFSDGPLSSAVEDGFTLTTSADLEISSQQLFVNIGIYSPSSLTISSTDTFTFQSLDAAAFGPVIDFVTVSGTPAAGGASVSDSYTLMSPSFVTQTANNLAGIDFNVLTVTFNNNGTPAAVDNINLTSSSSTPTPVPLPGAVWLLGSALLGFVGFRKKFS